MDASIPKLDGAAVCAVFPLFIMKEEVHFFNLHPIQASQDTGTERPSSESKISVQPFSTASPTLDQSIRKVITLW